MTKTPRAIVSVTNDLLTDNRADKICLFLMEQGYSVLLVGRKKKDSSDIKKRKYKTIRFSLFFETGFKFYASFNLRLFFFLIFRRANILVSNDLDTLLANYLASKLKRKCKLTYDSHEYFTEVPELINRPKVRNFWLKIERFIFPKLKSVYTVNESIANIYKKKYNVNVDVIRNISNRWTQKLIKSKSELGVPENTRLIIIQGAGINIDRGAEEAVQAMTNINATLMIVGDGDVIPELKKRVVQLGLSKKVIFYKKEPYSTMMNYTYFADIGLTLDKPSNLNYKLSLPNKVFDYIHAATPIISTNITEVSKVVTTYDVGVIINDFNSETLAKKIEELLNNQKLLDKFKKNCALAAKIENWEIEKKKLKTIYPSV